MSGTLMAIIPANTTRRSLKLPARLKGHLWEDFVTGTVEHFIPGEIVVISDQSISPDTEVTVEINAGVLEGQVLYCCPRDGCHEIHISIKDTDANGYRRAPRFLVKLPARVFNSGIDGSLAATIVDISGDGIGLETTMNLAVESAVVVESQWNLALGIVRYSKQSGQVYRIGIKVHHIIPRRDRAEKPSRLGNLLSFGRRK